MKPFVKFLLLGAFGIGYTCTCAHAEEVEISTGSEMLPLKQFIRLAAENDTVFESILIDELPLKYRKDLGLPARDIVLSVKSQYDFILDQDRQEPEAVVSLEKLFPYSGTNLSGEYRTAPSFRSDSNASALTLTVSQPIAENAFGKVTRFEDKIIGIEIDVARHQIVEAYEDYLALLMTHYYDWYEAYENLEIGESSYNENLKLLDNIHQRKVSKIALPIDVNKIKLQVLDKKEKLIDLKQKYRNALNLILRSLRDAGKDSFVPQKPVLHDEMKIEFEKDFGEFKEDSRTYRVLNFLKEQSDLIVERNLHELLPSLNLLLGYNTEGRDLELADKDQEFFAGISLELPIGDQVQRAEYKTAKVLRDKTKLTNLNTHYRLYTDVRNLSERIRKEILLTATANEKVKLSRSILVDETENFSFGKVTLNDYIDAVNKLDNNRFNQISREVQHKRLLIEWLRITDRLVMKKDVLERAGEIKN